MKVLESDIEEGITNDFSLFDTLTDLILFKDEFIHYINNQNPNLYEYPYLYDFANLVHNNSPAVDQRTI